MVARQYHILQSSLPDFSEAATQIVAQAISLSRDVVRIIFFSDASNPVQYDEQYGVLSDIIESAFAERRPVWALVAQRPLEAILAAEVTTLSSDTPFTVRFEGEYLLINEEELICSLSSALCPFDGGGSEDMGSISDLLFDRLAHLLESEGFTVEDIVRQWNYIEHITFVGERGQNYQLFNDSRSRLYERGEWCGGYPAATGIGTEAGGVVVVVDVMRGAQQRTRAINNPLQISAHSYSSQVLVSENSLQQATTPKFERARYVEGRKDKDGESEHSPSFLYISGTAAIRGEDSCRYSLEEQLHLTMDNIGQLIRECRDGEMEYELLRVYIKHCSNWQMVTSWLKEYYPATQILLLDADICRDELLVEIEGIAHKRK